MNCELSLIAMHQYRLISCNNCTTLVGDDDSGQGWGEEEGNMWELCFLLSFAVNIKLPLNNKVY